MEKRHTPKGLSTSLLKRQLCKHHDVVAARKKETERSNLGGIHWGCELGLVTVTGEAPSLGGLAQGRCYGRQPPLQGGSTQYLSLSLSAATRRGNHCARRSGTSLVTVRLTAAGCQLSTDRLRSVKLP